MKAKPVKDQVWNQVLSPVYWQVRNLVGLQVWDQVNDRVYSQVRNQFINPVFDQVQEEKRRKDES